MKRRILVVDDEARVLLILAEALKRLGNGYEVVTAQSGAGALEKARRQDFDLVISDLKMPDMAGQELTRRIRQLSPRTTVIWITAYGCHNVSGESAALGVFCCLDKPLEIGLIRKAAVDALRASSGGAEANHDGG